MRFGQAAFDSKVILFITFEAYFPATFDYVVLGLHEMTS
jgi:hypothetical protein